MSGRDGRDLPWNSPVKVSVGPETLKGSKHNSLKDLVSNCASQDGGYSSSSGASSCGFMNPKSSNAVSMVRRSVDEIRTEAPATPSPGTTTAPSRQLNRVAPVKEPEVETTGPPCLTTTLLPGDPPPIIGQRAAPHKDGGGWVPDMRSAVNTSATAATSANPVTTVVTTPAGSRTPSPRLQRPPPRLPPVEPASGAALDSNPHSSACDSTLAAAPQAGKQRDTYGNSQDSDLVFAKPTTLPSHWHSSSSLSKPSSTSSKPFLPLTSSQGGLSSFVQPLPVAQQQQQQESLQHEKHQTQEQHHDLCGQSCQTSIAFPGVKASNSAQVHQSSPFIFNKNNNNNTCNKDNNEGRRCKQGEFEGDSSTSANSTSNQPVSVVVSVNQAFCPTDNRSVVHFSNSGCNADPLKPILCTDTHFPKSDVTPVTKVAFSDHSGVCAANCVESVPISVPTSVEALGPGILTPFHSISCSPAEYRRLRKEPSIDDRDEIPLDFIYRNAEKVQKCPSGKNDVCDEGSKINNKRCDGLNAVNNAKSVSSGLNLENKFKDKDTNVFRFLLDGQSIDLSCEDEDSFSGTGRRKKPTDDSAKVRRSNSTPNSLALRPDDETRLVSNKKSSSILLRSEAQSSYPDKENGTVSTAGDDSIVFPSDKRFSAGQSSIVTVVTSDSECKGDKKKGKKKRKRLWKKRSKNDANAQDKDASSVLSLSLPGRESKRSSKGSGGSAGGGLGFFKKKDKKDNENAVPADEGDGDVGSRPPSVASSAKGPRRLARRGIGMFPSSNWRRLRNTLKAANEMQGPKKPKHTLTREDSFLRKFSTRNHHQNVHNSANSTDDDSRWGGSGGGGGGGGGGSGGGATYTSEGGVRRIPGRRFVIQHDGNFMFYWLGVVTVSVLYNLWTCIAREAFREIQQSCTECWFAFDALFDTIYILDIIIQFRTGYLDQGLMVYDSRKLRDRYTHSRIVYIDFLCLIPLDFLQLLIGIHPMIRFPRFLKIYRSFRFIHMLESRTAYPNLIRVANLTHILFLGAHWFAAFYYMISEAENFEGEWAYPKPVGEFADVTRKYLRSLFWSTLTLTTIGDLPPPDNSEQYVFVIVSYLIGVFVFATIVGQVGNVINNRNASRQEFERLLDGAKIYMQTHNVPHNLQKRVQRWYDYVWSRGRLNGCDINSLGLLPDKLKTELAIHVNLETLKKVTIFQECQPEFLHDLVLKMKAYIFTPGDLICRRGEVAREMFIIADGVVEIISETGVMLKRMGAGDFFGEIGILNLDGGINRRTADVRSVGYLELFVLSREDVLGALKDHPEAESIIRDYGQRRLREVEAHRQKVKPLKIRGNQEVTSASGNSNSSGPGSGGGGGGGAGSAGSQTVPNRLLATLRSLNPAVRRQSSQMNHYTGSPPASAGSGGPTISSPVTGLTTEPFSPAVGVSVGGATPVPSIQHQQQQQPQQQQQQQQQCLQPGSGGASHRFVPQSVASSGLYDPPLSQQQQLQQIQSSGSEDLTSLGGAGSDSVVAAECLEATLAHLQHKHRRQHQHQHYNQLEQQQQRQQHMFSEDYSSGRRRSFAYIRTAYTKFRNVFHRKRHQQQRRSLDSALHYGVSGKGSGGWGLGGAKRGVSKGGVGTQSLEVDEGRLYGGSGNIETCSLGSQTPRGKWLIGSDDDADEEDRLMERFNHEEIDASNVYEDKPIGRIRSDGFKGEEENENKEVNDVSRMNDTEVPSSEGKQDSVCSFNTISKPRTFAKLASKEAPWRKPVSRAGLLYMPLCTENLDEGYMHKLSKDELSRDRFENVSGVNENKHEKRVAFEEENWRHSTGEEGEKMKRGNNISSYHSVPDVDSETSLGWRDCDWSSVSPGIENLPYYSNPHGRERQSCNHIQQERYACTGKTVHEKISGMPGVYDAYERRDNLDSSSIPRGANVSSLNRPSFASSLITREGRLGFRDIRRSGNIAGDLLQCVASRYGSLPSVANREAVRFTVGSSPSDHFGYGKDVHSLEGDAFQDSSSRSVTNVLSGNKIFDKRFPRAFSPVQYSPQTTSFISPLASCSPRNDFQKAALPCVSFLDYPRQGRGEEPQCLPQTNCSSGTRVEDSSTAGMSQSWSNETISGSTGGAACDGARPRSRTSEFKSNRVSRMRERVRLVQDGTTRPASPTAFDLMCRCDPAENFNRYIGNRRFPGRTSQSGHSSLSCHNKELKNTADAMSSLSGITTSGFRDTDRRYRTNNGDSAASTEFSFYTSEDTAPRFEQVRGKTCAEIMKSFHSSSLVARNLTPHGEKLTPLRRRSTSFPNLQDIRNSEHQESRARRSSSQEERHFTFEDTSGPNLSPTVNRLRKHNADGIQREGSGKCGRSQPMSIIQAAASEHSYQQIAEQIQYMSGMIDKRLTQLEEVYNLTTERLTKLATSQETLLRVLSQKTSRLDRGSSSSQGAGGLDSLDAEDGMTASRV